MNHHLLLLYLSLWLEVLSVWWEFWSVLIWSAQIFWDHSSSQIAENSSDFSEQIWSDSNCKQGRSNESHDYWHHLSLAFCSVRWVDHVTSHMHQLCNHTHHFPTFPPSTPSHHSPPITHSHHPLAPTPHSHEDHWAKGITKHGSTITTSINIMSAGNKSIFFFFVFFKY